VCVYVCLGIVVRRGESFAVYEAATVQRAVV